MRDDYSVAKLPKELGAELDKLADKRYKGFRSRNAIVTDAVRLWLKTEAAEASASTFQGIHA